MNHGKTYTTDCQNYNEKEARVEHIKKSILLIGDLDDSQKKKLLEIADKCPAHKSLNNTVVVQSGLLNKITNANKT